MLIVITADDQMLDIVSMRHCALLLIIHSLLFVFIFVT